MKLNFLNITAGVFFAALLLTSCEKGDTHHPDLIQGVNMRIQVDPSTQFINAGNIPTATIILHLFTENDDISKVDLMLDYYDASEDSLYERALLRTITPDQFADGILRDLTFTTQELGAAAGIAVQDMGAGDRLDIYNFTTLEDGRVYPSDVQLEPDNSVSNVTPNIQNSAISTSFTTKLVFFISCPFNADAAVGEYLITRDDFETSLDYDRPIQVVKESETEVTFINLFSHPEMYDVTVSVNLASGVATVARQPAWHCDNFGCGFGEGRVDGGGFFFSCTGFVTLDLRHTVDAGSFGVFKLELQKQ